MLDSYTQTFTQIDTIYLKKIVEINSNGLAKLFISIEKKTLLVVVILIPTYKLCWIQNLSIVSCLNNNCC